LEWIWGEQFKQGEVRQPNLNSSSGDNECSVPTVTDESG
jgi:hypothetical protein